MIGLPRLTIFIAAAVIIFCQGCGGLHVNIGTESRKEPLKEYTLQGTGRGKVLVIPIRGFLSDAPRKGLLSDRASTVEEVVSQLRLAEKDEEIKAVLLEIDSPGGSTTASDILYHEIMEFKQKTGAGIVAVLMDVAASGGYYVALPADRIVAHPTTVTGSIGVILLVPKAMGLMDKLGLAVDVKKSGMEKDMGSPFRPSTPEEQQILQNIIDKLGGQFVDLVAKHRKIDPKELKGVSTARIYSAQEALDLRLVDRVGYMSDAVSEAQHIAGLSKDTKVVVYRRSKRPNDTIYHTSLSDYGSGGISLVELNLSEIIPSLRAGFYYLWIPGGSGN